MGVVGGFAAILWGKINYSGSNCISHFKVGRVVIFNRYQTILPLPTPFHSISRYIGLGEAILSYNNGLKLSRDDLILVIKICLAVLFCKCVPAL